MERKYRIRTIFCMTFVGVIILASMCIYQKNSNAKNNTEKKVITGEGMWPAYSFASAVDEAATILYGKVLDKSDTKVHQMAYVNGRSYNEY